MQRTFYLIINNEKIAVSEEVYYNYKRAVWNEQKQKERRAPKEQSFEALRESGHDIPADRRLVEEIVEDKLLLEALVSALNELTEEEHALVDALFYHGKTEAQLSRETGVPRKTLSYRKTVLINKLRSIMGKNT